MKKKILTILGVILAIIVLLITYFVVADLNQENKLKKELTEIIDLVNEENIDLDKINKKLNTIITTDDYAKVEESFKNYLKDSFDNTIELSSLLNDERIESSLTVENYKEDGADFKNTKAYLNETINSLEECKNKYYEFLSEENAMSYINNKNLDSYYIDFYKNEIVKDIENEKNDKTIENSVNDVISLLKNVEKVINFLSDNKDAWQIEGENIVFNSDALTNQYIELIDNL